MPRWTGRGDCVSRSAGLGRRRRPGRCCRRLLADRLGLTSGLARVVARAGFWPRRHRGRLLVDTVCALATGATCLADVEAMTAQEEIFAPGGGAWDSTMVRAPGELAGRIGENGLPRRHQGPCGGAGAGMGRDRGPPRTAACGAGRRHGPHLTCRRARRQPIAGVGGSPGCHGDRGGQSPGPGSG